MGAACQKRSLKCRKRAALNPWRNRLDLDHGWHNDFASSHLGHCGPCSRWRHRPPLEISGSDLGRARSGRAGSSRAVAWHDALAAIGKGTDVYLFLTGMMLLAELARREGLFDWLIFILSAMLAVFIAFRRRPSETPPASNRAMSWLWWDRKSDRQAASRDRSRGTTPEHSPKRTRPNPSRAVP